MARVPKPMKKIVVAFNPTADYIRDQYLVFANKKDAFAYGFVKSEIATYVREEAK